MPHVGVQWIEPTRRNRERRDNERIGKLATRILYRARHRWIHITAVEGNSSGGDASHGYHYHLGRLEGDKMTINLKSDIQAIIQSISILHSIAYSEVSWMTKYELVFTQADSVKAAIKEIGMELEWYDPDESYELDLMAFIKALDEIGEELAIVLEAME